MKYTREQIEAYQKDIKEYAKNKYPHRRLNFSIGEEFLEHKFPKQLPEEGLLVHRLGSIVYRTGKNSGYGFDFNKFYKNYIDEVGWTFNRYPTQWRKATEKEEKDFVEMLWEEWVKMGNNENTKLECHAKDSPPNSLFNKGVYDLESTCHTLWNKNGVIFHRGKFAKPLKDLDYFKENAKKDYIRTPDNVLKYISELEEKIKL